MDANTTPRGEMMRTDDRHHHHHHHLQLHYLHNRRAWSSGVVEQRRFNPEPGSGSCFIRRNVDRPKGFREYFDSRRRWRNNNIVCVTRAYIHGTDDRGRGDGGGGWQIPRGITSAENRLETVYGPFIISCFYWRACARRIIL